MWEIGLTIMQKVGFLGPRAQNWIHILGPSTKLAPYSGPKTETWAHILGPGPKLAWAKATIQAKYLELATDVLQQSLVYVNTLYYHDLLLHCFESIQSWGASCHSELRVAKWGIAP